MPDPSTALAVRNLTKTFGGARALDDVTFQVGLGEVHGLLGHNGSGKSTLVKVLSGYHVPDPGADLALYGRPLSFPLLPGELRDLGFGFVQQNLGLVPSLSVLDNLRVAELTGRGRPFISWRSEMNQARIALQRFGVDIDIGLRVADLSLGDRALLAIVRAIEEIRAGRAQHGNPGVFVLDEPTPFLPRDSVLRLFRVVRGLVAEGASVIFISHDIDEVLEITDRVTVLRDGKVIGTSETRQLGRADLVEMIVGRKLETGRRETKATSSGLPRVRVSGLRDRRLSATDFAIAQGEILGMTGLIGSGFERVAPALFGASSAEAGTLELDGRSTEIARQTPRRAVTNGIAFLPADRPRASGVGGITVAENMMLPDLARFFRNGRLNRKGLTARAQALSRQYQVRPNNPALKLSALSGGNAQKVLLAKWLNREPRLLLLDEPTQGVDVGSREQVYEAIRQAAGHGAAVLCASSDHEQLADLCDRVLIFSRGRLSGELKGDELTKAAIAARCYAAETPDPAATATAAAAATAAGLAS